jgi:hypothetical protein
MKMNESNECMNQMKENGGRGGGVKVKLVSNRKAQLQNPPSESLVSS